MFQDPIIGECAEAACIQRADVNELIIDVDGFEGPLDLLLELSRRQKVDLKKISILKLAEQYAEYIQNAKSLRIGLAADYLVMAAWLALLKSRLLLPEDKKTEESAEEAASRLAIRLQRLDAMRSAGKSIFRRNQLGKEFFPRGATEEVKIVRHSTVSANVFDLTQAYMRIKSREDFRPFSMNRGPVYSVEVATSNLRRLLGESVEWAELMKFLPADWLTDGRRVRSALASTFAAALELAKQGQLELMQEKPFEPIQIKGFAA